MIYVLYGNKNVLIEKFVLSIIKKEKINDVIKYNFKESSLNEIIEDASYAGLFENKKAIVVENSEFLCSGFNDDTTALEKYINSPNEETYLFFITNNDSMDQRKKIVKLLRKNAIVNEYNNISEYDLIKYIKEYLNNYQIDNNECKKIIDLLNGELNLFDKELDKLKLYISDKKITMEDINKVISRMPKDDAFELVDAVMKNDKDKMFLLYKDLVLIGEEPIKLVVLLYNQFKLYYQVKVLLHDGFKEDEISRKLEVHPYRVKLAIQNSANYKEEKLLYILERLIGVDKSIKLGTVSKNQALEMFFLEL